MTLARPFLSKEIVNMVTIIIIFTIKIEIKKKVYGINCFWQMSFHTSAEPFFGELSPEIVPEDYNGSAQPILSLHSK